MRIKLMLLSIWCTAVMYGQDRIPTVAPLLPNAAALYKPVERQQGNFTGGVPVDFHLLSIASGNLKTSLDLSYSGTTGIRVEEAASSVGLGFSLADGGGRITQIIHGQGDDWYYGHLTNTITPANFRCWDVGGDVWSAYYAAYQVDKEPDIFLINVMGKTVKFFIDQQNRVIVMQKSGLKVEWTLTDGRNYINTWTITDDQSNKYYFSGRYESQCYTYDDVGGHGVNAAASVNWYMDSAKDVTGKNVLYFNYQQTGDVITSFSGGRLVLMPTAGCNLFDIDTHSSSTTTDGTEMLVSKITARSGFILISASNGRQDSYGRKVDSIRLFTPDSQLVKKYTFNYDYFTAGSNMYDKRLYMKDFSEWGGQGTDSMTHRFEYNTTDVLPSRLSYRMDYWGYYNGAYNNTNFPNYVFKNGFAEYRSNSNADKSANGTYAQACALKKITFPTGGTREFVYEGNSALVTFNPNLYHPDGNNSRTQQFYHDEYEFTSDYGFDPFFIKYFQVNSTDGGAYFQYNMVVPYSCGVEVKLYKVSTANQSTGGDVVYDYNYATSKDNLSNGYYRMEFYRQDPACWISSIFGTWGECILSLGTVQNNHYPYGVYNENDMAVGGIRVFRTIDTDPVTGKTNTTEYRYKLYSGDSSHTSGLLISQPVYIAAQQPPGVGCYVNAILANSNYPLASQGGSYVVYTEVRTINSEGCRDKIFSFEPDNITSSTYPYTQPDDNSAFRGQLVEERVYDSARNLLQKTNTSYFATGYQYTQAGIQVAPYWAPDITIGCDDWKDHPCSSGMSPTVAFCNSYYIRGNATDVYEIIDTVYSTGGAVGQKTHNDYDTILNGRISLKKVRVDLGQGKYKVTTHRYPYTSTGEFLFGLSSGELTVKSALQGLNFLQPIEDVDSLYVPGVGGMFVGGTKYIYTNNGGDYLLTKVRKYTTLGDSVEVNLAYDVKGNLTEKFNTNNVKEVYLWGYNYTYPVAKVTNSDYSTVSALVNNTIIQNPSSAAALQTELDKIRNAFSGSKSEVSTYSYTKGLVVTEVNPAGVTHFYKYDNHSRLMEVRDQDNKLVKKIEYKIANPQ